MAAQPHLPEVPEGLDLAAIVGQLRARGIRAPELLVMLYGVLPNLNDRGELAASHAAIAASAGVHASTVTRAIPTLVASGVLLAEGPRRRLRLGVGGEQNDNLSYQTLNRERCRNAPDGAKMHRPPAPSPDPNPKKKALPLRESPGIPVLQVTNKQQQDQPIAAAARSNGMKNTGHGHLGERERSVLAALLGARLKGRTIRVNDSAVAHILARPEVTPALVQAAVAEMARARKPINKAGAYLHSMLTGGWIAEQLDRREAAAKLRAVKAGHIDSARADRIIEEIAAEEARRRDLAEQEEAFALIDAAPDAAIEIALSKLAADRGQPRRLMLDVDVKRHGLRGAARRRWHALVPHLAHVPLAHPGALAHVRTQRAIGAMLEWAFGADPRQLAEFVAFVIAHEFPEPTRPVLAARWSSVPPAELLGSFPHIFVRHWKEPRRV